MKRILILIASLILMNKESNAQLVKVFESDSLKIYTNKDGENIKSSFCELRFVSEFNDSINVFINDKLLFSKFITADSTIVSTRVDRTVPAIKIPIKTQRLKLKIMFLKENLYIKSEVIKGYKYAYVYKQGKNITLYYRNEELLFY